MVAFEDKLVFFKCGGKEETIVEDTEDEVVEAMRDGS